MSNPRTIKPTGQGTARTRPRQPSLVITASAAAVAVVIVTIALLAWRPSPTPLPPSPSAASVSSGPPVTRPPAKQAEQRSHSALVDDDGETLWQSPTDGRPLELAYVPPGAQIVCMLRPAAWLAHPEGEKLCAALGPLGEQAIRSVEQLSAASLADIERLAVGCQVLSDGRWLVTLVVHGAELAGWQAEAWAATAVEKQHGGETYHAVGDRAYYVPARNTGRVLVVAPQESIADVIDLQGESPPLRRDTERLLAQTDADRHFTILVAPNSLFSEGQSLFTGTLVGLRQPLFWFLGDEPSAAALSLHWEAENFFAELIATPTLDTPPERTVRLFEQRLKEIPEKLETFVLGLEPSPHSRFVLARFPAMVRKLAAYTRSGFDRDHAVLRCYLPAVAGHNLLMAAELTLAEQTGGVALPAEQATTAQQAFAWPGSARAHLQQRTTLRFARDTLEAALEMLAQDVGVPIRIDGAGLQLEGITKNQSFGIEITDRPAEEILIEILRLANPDQTATSTHDQRQKLVYIIAPMDGAAEEVVVTTRSAAAARGDELPPAFQLQ